MDRDLQVGRRARDLCHGFERGADLARIKQNHPFAPIIKPIEPAELGRVLAQAAGRQS